MKNYLIWFCILILLAIDQLTKWVFYDLKLWQELTFFYPTLNTGISRGIGIHLPIIILISLFGFGLFFWLWKKKQFTDLIFVLFLAGTVGNLVDRIFLGGVRDFISIGSFPIFNLADCFLSLAVGILLLKEIFPCNREKKH